jgi:molybdate transport system ATP-binding protein
MDPGSRGRPPALTRMLRAHLTRRLDAFELDATLELEAGSTVVLVGESGSGKTTLLRLLAGLLRPDRGRIELDGELWFDATSGFSLAAERRAVGYVAQDHSLFPHLSAHENVAFGLRAQRVSRQQRRYRAEQALARLGITDLAGRRPAALSGGQAQRVALARALVLEPRLLLLDEPLSALDLQTRRAVRGELRRMLAALPCATVYVTHSPIEAMVFGERIMVLEHGRVTQSGARADLLRYPRSPYVAEFLGLNLFRGPLVERRDEGLAQVASPAGRLTVVDPGGDEEVFVTVSPRDITLSRERPAGSAQNVFAGTVEEIAPEPPAGERLRVTLASQPPLVAEITRQSAEALGLRPGLAVFASFKATGASTYR